MRLGEAPPPPTYPEYAELWEAARACSGFVNPAQIWEPQKIADRRGWDWATAVIGRPFAGLRHISSAEARLITLADAAGVDPPLPEWLLADRAETASRVRALAERRAEARRRDEQAWASARGACPVALEVRQNQTARVRGGQRQNLGHAVPLADATSGTRGRVHAAGRALCETAGRRPMRLTEPVSEEPVTCVRCLEWAPKIRPVRPVDSR